MRTRSWSPHGDQSLPPGGGWVEILDQVAITLFAFADFSGKYDYRSGACPQKSKEMPQCISLWETAMI